jgi:hypothetical protein
MPIAFPFEAPAEPLCAGSAPQSKPECKQTLAIPDQASGCRRLFPRAVQIYRGLRPDNPDDEHAALGR